MIYNDSNRKTNKGFTLVELIVVIVILAILAAILVPQLLGYIDRAKGGDVLVEAKYAYQEAQVILTEFYATEGELYADYFKASKSKNTCFVDDNGVKQYACCITQSSLSTIQSMYTREGAARVESHLAGYYEGYKAGNTSNSFSYGAHYISFKLLQKMDSLNRKTAKYTFLRNDRASKVTYDDYYNSASNISNSEGSNPLIYQLFFDEKGRILMFEYGKNGYLVRFYDGKTYVEKNGKTFENH